jgi:hypothetical protein
MRGTIRRVDTISDELEEPLLALVCIAPDISQERRMLRVAETRLTQVPGTMLWTTDVLLNEYGPLGPIWLKQIPLRSHVEQRNNIRRQFILDMVPEKLPSKAMLDYPPLTNGCT